ncbi:MAG: DUF6838 family protein [Caldicoprobacterales bacterium]
MINDIKQAVANKLLEIYPGYTVYDEDIPQNFKTPSFLVTVIDQSYGKRLANKYIDCEDFSNLEGCGFNELWINTDNVIEKYESAKRQTAQLLTLVDNENANDKSLSAKMDRYLESAALVVFSKYRSLNDVFEVLRNHRIRHDYINRIREDEKYLLAEYIETLLELDDKDKKLEK